jgi:hypothetical protein
VPAIGERLVRATFTVVLSWAVLGALCGKPTHTLLCDGLSCVFVQLSSVHSQHWTVSAVLRKYMHLVFEGTKVGTGADVPVVELGHVITGALLTVGVRA